MADLPVDEKNKTKLAVFVGISFVLGVFGYIAAYAIAH
jgi:VIT1/CCC1 family predicted Fe2+/Mn2+ transporter